MALRRNPTRSKRFSPYKGDSEDGSGKDDWFPELVPLCPVHKQINILNKEAYAATAFSRADDLLMFALFANKGKKRRHHQIKRPEPAQALTASELDQTTSRTPLSNEDSRRVAKLCKPLLAGGGASWKDVESTVFKLQEDSWRSSLNSGPSMNSSNGLPVCSTCSTGTCSSTHRQASCESARSPIRDRMPPSASRASRDIDAGTYIMETCSSMSLDTVHRSGPSVIEAAARQLGPQGPRLILGPFRLVNHDCKPNAQIYPIPGTHACVVVTLEAIASGEEITVKYRGDGYDGQNCRCKTCTGVDPTDLSVLKPKGSNS